MASCRLPQGEVEADGRIDKVDIAEAEDGDARKQGARKHPGHSRYYATNKELGVDAGRAWTQLLSSSDTKATQT